MRLHRFFIDSSLLEAVQTIPDLGEILVSDSNLSHQLKRVFRFISGDQVILFDGNGFDFICEILSFEKESIRFLIKEKKENKFIPKTEIYLFASLIKNNNYELVLEKCTEIGVAHFVPIISERSEKKKLNYERSQKIIKEASEQSGRGFVPKIYDTILPQEIFEKYDMPFIVFHGDGENFRNNFEFQIYNTNKNKIGILIGPEGGWSEKELRLFKEKNITTYSLGSQTLRAETATIVSSAFLLL